MSGDDVFDNVADLVPDGAVAECAMRVVGYLHEETGEQSYSYIFEGEVPIAHSLGLMLMSMFDSMHDIAHESGDEDA